MGFTALIVLKTPRQDVKWEIPYTKMRTKCQKNTSKYLEPMGQRYDHFTDEDKKLKSMHSKESSHQYFNRSEPEY